MSIKSIKDHATFLPNIPNQTIPFKVEAFLQHNNFSDEQLINNTSALKVLRQKTIFFQNIFSSKCFFLLPYKKFEWLGIQAGVVVHIG